MWPGPYGRDGGSRKHMLSSLDQSLCRLGVDYVDIYYSHRFDPETPIEDTMMALDQAVRSGKAVYAGISSYSATRTREAATIARELGTPLLIHQPSYSMLNRWIEEDLLDELEEQGMGCIVFTALAQGLLTDRYLDGVPPDSRAAREGSTIGEGHLDEATLGRVRRLNEIAEGRGQRLAQLALQWALRDRRVTSAVIGASSVEQLDTNLDALDGPGGVSGLAAGFAHRAVALRTAVAAYQAVDAATERAIDTVRWFGGYLAGLTAPMAAPALLAGYAVLRDQNRLQPWLQNVEANDEQNVVET